MKERSDHRRMSAFHHSDIISLLDTLAYPTGIDPSLKFLGLATEQREDDSPPSSLFHQHGNYSMHYRTPKCFMQESMIFDRFPTASAAHLTSFLGAYSWGLIDPEYALSSQISEHVVRLGKHNTSA